MTWLKSLAYLVGLPLFLVLIWWGFTLGQAQLLLPCAGAPGGNVW